MGYQLDQCRFGFLLATEWSRRVYFIFLTMIVQLMPLGFDNETTTHVAKRLKLCFYLKGSGYLASARTRTAATIGTAACFLPSPGS